MDFIPGSYAQIRIPTYEMDYDKDIDKASLGEYLPTWEKYDMTSPAGVKKVIEMEYKELMSATTEAETTENIYHLSVALLRLWRLHHAKHGAGR